jgi:hypothetical protein
MEQKVEVGCGEAENGGGALGFSKDSWKAHVGSFRQFGELAYVQSKSLSDSQVI